MQTSRLSTRILVLAACVMFTGAMVLPETAEASLWKKIKKTAKKAAKTVKSETKSIVDKAEEAGSEVGDTVLDEGADIGKAIKKEGTKTTYEVKEGGKVVGHLVVQGGKVVATETVEKGKVVATEVEKGPKFLVDGGKIVGQEVMVNGKVVGQSVIKNGKVVGLKAIEGGDYIVKEGQLILKEITSQACKLLVAGLREGKNVASHIPDFSNIFDGVKKRTGLKRAELAASRQGAALVSAATRQIRAAKQLEPELKRIADVMKANSSKINDLFKADTLCGSRKDLEAKLKALNLQPSSRRASLFDDGFFIREAHAARAFYMAYNLTVSGAAFVGATTSLSIVTDYNGHTGVFVAIGPQLSTAKSIGGSIGIQFFPSVEFGDFKSWGWGLGGSVDILEIYKKSAIDGSLGLDISLNENLSKLEGWGITVGAGVGKPAVEGGLSATHSWKIN